jgi:uncharacterized protein YecE (DUF72 family)
MMNFHVGTSGYSYKEWKGSFYPAKLPAKEMLSFYAQHFSTVEMNNTHYKMPTVEGVEAWTAQVPADFRFIMKAPQSITHFKRLRNVDADVTTFLTAAAALGKRRGPLLFQLPPNFKQDLPRLEGFLNLLADVPQVVMEFRHESWFNDETYALLRAHHCALCVNDAEDVPTAELIATAKFGYLRLRREDYAPSNLAAWLKQVRAQKWTDAYILFRHEDTAAGPAFAKQLLELIGAS